MASQLEAYLPHAIYALLQHIGEEAFNLKQDAYIVGGIVRDLFLDRPNYDIDIVVGCDAIKLARKMAKESELLLTEHLRFGTATLNYDSFRIDLATTRSEHYSRPGALPIVTTGTIVDDLSRRDFSINAMAIYISPKRFGELADLHNGRYDIENKCIRILHDRSFVDDATRMFRALRYEQRLHFTIEDTTLKLMKRDLDYIDTISGDRIRHEIELFFREEQPELMLNRASALGIMRKLHPCLNNNQFRNRTFKVARETGKQNQTSLYWCLFLYELTDQESGDIILRLNPSKTIATAIQEMQLLKSKLPYLNEPRIRPSDIYALLHGYSSAAIQANAVATELPLVQENLNLYLSKLRYVKCSLNGDDLQQIGVPAGTAIGQMLKTLRDARLNGLINSKKQEEELVYKLHPELRK